MYGREDLYRDMAENIYRDTQEIGKDDCVENTIDRLRRLVVMIENNKA